MHLNCFGHNLSKRGEQVGPGGLEEQHTTELQQQIQRQVQEQYREQERTSSFFQRSQLLLIPLSLGGRSRNKSGGSRNRERTSRSRSSKSSQVLLVPLSFSSRSRNKSGDSSRDGKRSLLSS